MLSFEQKKSIFRSFQELQEKPISNHRLNYIYPDSLQKGKILATQLQPSGNGYVIGKYMDEETIRAKGYAVDPRGWINIKEFSSGDLHEIITTAMMSMLGETTNQPSTALDSKQNRHQNILEKEKQTKPSFEGWGGSYVYNWLGFGVIRAPLWLEQSGAEMLSIQTKTLEQSLECVQRVTNIWMSAMFGKMDIENQ
jgi:hypothetical protein